MTDIIADFHRVAEQSGVRVGQLFEDTVQKIYEAWLKPGDYAVDVGAHKGRHLFPMLKAVGPMGQVYAFEPIKSLYKNLERELKKRQFTNAKLFELALGRQLGKIPFNYFENRPAFSGIERRGSSFTDSEGGLSKINVQCATLDSKLPVFKRISAIKLDIEGGELHALMGARKCLSKSRPLTVFENGRQASAKVYGYTADDFFQFFESVDMRVFWLSGEEFTLADWQKNKLCWEFVALPSENAGFADRLPDLCKEALAANSSGKGA